MMIFDRRHVDWRSFEQTRKEVSSLGSAICLGHGHQKVVRIPLNTSLRVSRFSAVAMLGLSAKSHSTSSFYTDTILHITSFHVIIAVSASEYSNMPSSSQHSSSQFSQRRIPTYKPLKPTSLNQNSLPQFKTRKPATSPVSTAKLDATARFVHQSSSSPVERAQDPSRPPIEVLRDRDATLNERISALAKTQWTRMDKMDSIEKKLEALDKKMGDTVAHVRTMAEHVVECNESSKLTLDTVHALREESMSACTGDKLLSMLRNLTAQCTQLQEQNEAIRRQHEVDMVTITGMATRIRRMEERLKHRPELAAPHMSHKHCCGQLPKEQFKVDSDDPAAKSPKKPRRSTRVRKSGS